MKSKEQERTSVETPEGKSSLEEEDIAQRGSPMSVIVLMGKTGAGKSSFIRLLGGKNLWGQKPAVDSGLYSCTKKPNAYMTKINGRRIILLDTPGFDDSAKENLEVLNDIVSHLYAYTLRRTEVETRGVIFLHDISETRFAGSQRKTLDILKSLVGIENLGNVIVGTTMWSSPGSDKFKMEEQREQSLLDGQWKGIYKTTRVPDGDKDTATSIVTELFARPPVTLLSQKEMLRFPNTVESTTAGKLVIPESRLELEGLQREREEREKAFQEEVQRREGTFQRLEEVRRKLGEGRYVEFKQEEKGFEEPEAERVKEKIIAIKAALKISAAPPDLGWFMRVIEAIRLFFFAWFFNFNGVVPSGVYR